MPTSSLPPIMAEVDPDTVEFWRLWSVKWHRRINCLTGSRRRTRRRRRKVRASQVLAAWLRLFMPAVDPEHVMPDWWIALSDDQKRASPAPAPILQPRRVSPASERGPGVSMDDAGIYFKLPDGTIFRDQASARQRLWRDQRRYPGVAQALSMLPARLGVDEHRVRGRTPERVVDALVSFGLVHAGLSQVDAARYVLDWTNQSNRSPKKYAEQSRLIWQELRLPPVKVLVNE